MGRGISHWGCRLNNWGSVDSRGWSSVCDRNDWPAWCCLNNWGGGSVVGIVLGVGQVRVLDLRGDHITSMVGRHCSRDNRSSSRSSRFNGNWSSSRCGDSNWSSSWGVNMMHWQVGGCNTEAHGIRNVIHSLDNSIGVNVAVASPGDSIGSLHLLLGLCGVGKAIVVLSKVVLSVELRVGSVNSSWCSDNGRGSGFDNNRRSSNSNRSSSRSRDRSINNMNWKVCGTNTEAKSICDVVHSLDNSVGVNIAVSSSGHTICCFDLLLYRVGVTVAIAVLADVILTVVLRSFRCCSMDNRSSCHNWCCHRSSDPM